MLHALALAAFLAFGSSLEPPLMLAQGPPAAGAAGAPIPPGSPIPEPGTLLLVGGGLVGIALTRRRFRRGAA